MRTILLENNMLDKTLLIYRETHRQIVIGSFSRIVLPLLLRSFDRKTYIDSDMIWMSRDFQTFLCDKSNIKLAFVLTE